MAYLLSLAFFTQYPYSETHSGSCQYPEFISFIAEYSILWIQYSLFSHSSSHGYLDRLPFLAVTNKAALNIVYKSLYGHILPFLLGKYLGLE